MIIARSIAGLVVGYVALFIAVFFGFTALWFIIGMDGTFSPDSWTVSDAWVYGGMIVGLIGGVVGGLVCRLVARTPTAVYILAGGVLAAGLVLAATYEPKVHPDHPAAPPANVNMMDAATYARKPPLSLWTDPFIGFVGVMVGGAVIRTRTPAKRKTS